MQGLRGQRWRLPTADPIEFKGGYKAGGSQIKTVSLDRVGDIVEGRGGKEKAKKKRRGCLSKLQVKVVSWSFTSGSRSREKQKKRDVLALWGG